MSVAASIRQMLAAGLSIEQALTAAEIMEANAPTAETVRTARQERNRRYYENKRLNSDDSDAIKTAKTVSDAAPSPLVPPLDKEIPPTPPKEIKSPPIIPPTRIVSAGVLVGEIVSDFDDFWQAYPVKTGKPKARLAYAAAIKRRDPGQPQTAPPDILEGLERAKRSEQWRNPKFIPHPTTWLNRDGWNDEYPTGNLLGGRGQGCPIDPYVKAALAVDERRRTGTGG